MKFLPYAAIFGGIGLLVITLAPMEPFLRNFELVAGVALIGIGLATLLIREAK